MRGNHERSMFNVNEKFGESMQKMMSAQRAILHFQCLKQWSFHARMQDNNIFIW